ncbi:MAG: glycosyltransferase family 4 protein [Chitinophagaceae bacterium]|nr:glycosyltransferase family 4 protein [Chitinophagaceae bacterium]
MTYKTAVLKRKIEYFFILPFIILGKIIGLFYKLKCKSQVFIFNPCADLGGSYKVNADIAEVLKDQKPIFIFSKKAKNNGYLSLFQNEHNTIVDVSKWVDNKWLYFNNIIFRGIISTWVNNCKNPILIGGESMYFYKIIQHVKKNTKVIEICHVNTWLNYNQAFISFIDKRIFSTPQVKKDIEEQYRRNNLPEYFYKKLYHIDNWIEIPEYQKTQNKNIEVLFVGRGADVKRVHLISKIADELQNENVPINFTFIGDVEKVVSEKTLKTCKILGNVSDKNILISNYQKADILILTSLKEGLPLVVMDMMAYGKTVLSTPAGGIVDYIFHLDNGLIIDELFDEEKIVAKGKELLKFANKNKDAIKNLGIKARVNAMKLFTKEQFALAYRKIVLND